MSASPGAPGERPRFRTSRPGPLPRVHRRTRLSDPEDHPHNKRSLQLQSYGPKIKHERVRLLEKIHAKIACGPRPVSMFCEDVRWFEEDVLSTNFEKDGGQQNRGA